MGKKKRKAQGLTSTYTKLIRKKGGMRSSSKQEKQDEEKKKGTKAPPQHLKRGGDVKLLIHHLWRQKESETREKGSRPRQNSVEDTSFHLLLVTC